MTECGPTGRTGAAGHTFGLMRIGGALVALPLAALREVVRGQPAYAGLPLQVDGLIGVIDIRGTIVPVLDLGGALGGAAQAGGDHVVVIVRWQGHLLGLRASEVCGIVRLPDEDLFALVTMGPRSGVSLATHTFRTGGEVAMVLDVKRLAERPDLPLVAEQAAERGAGRPLASETILLFSAGGAQMAIEATCVDATVPAVAIERNMMKAGVCLGTIDHRGFKVPVVDTRAAIGLGAAACLPEMPVIVVRFAPDAMLGFAIEAVSDIARIAASDVIPMPSMLGGEARLVRGVLRRDEGRQRLLLDADGLRAHPELAALAHLSRRIAPERRGATHDPAAADRRGAERGAAQPFLTYVAGRDHASPLSQVTEILAYPPDPAPFEAGCRGLRGLFAHRDRVVPLVCLGTVLGTTVAFDAGSARVLIVEDQGEVVGFLVQAVTSIETGCRRSEGEAAGGRPRLSHALAILGSGAAERIISCVDLRAILRSLAPAPRPAAEVPQARAAAIRKAS